MTVRRWSRWPAGAGALAALLVLGTADAPGPAGAPSPAATRASVPARATPGICTSATQPALAAKLSRQIARTLHGLSSIVGIAADDSEERLSCRYHQWREFHSASVIKVITLCALLYELQGQQNLSPEQAVLAQAMITESDNDAQDTLWNEVGMDALQRFLTAAMMDHTWLGPGRLLGPDRGERA